MDFAALTQFSSCNIPSRGCSSDISILAWLEVFCQRSRCLCQSKRGDGNTEGNPVTAAVGDLYSIYYTDSALLLFPNQTPCVVTWWILSDSIYFAPNVQCDLMGISYHCSNIYIGVFFTESPSLLIQCDCECISKQAKLLMKTG